MKYHFRVHKGEKFPWAQCIEGEWVTQGNSREELDFNMKEMLDLTLDEPEDSTWIPPMPDPAIKGRNIVAVEVDPRIAMAMMIRVSRLKHGLTQREAARRMGIANVSQYQRLESGKTANPELGTLVKIKKLFPEFSVDFVLA
jgi:antitoxin HicB